MARLWSVLLSTLTVLATYYLVRTGFPDWPGLALVAAGVLAFDSGIRLHRRLRQQ